MTEEKICVLPVIDGMASFMTGNVEIKVREQIVRCRDCRYWTFMTIDFGELFTPIKGHLCTRDNNYLAMSTIDFCSKGEPRKH